MIRFHPPEVAISPELGWVLLRAFGPPDAPLTTAGGLDPRSAVETARAMALAERIASRIPRNSLENELGPASAEPLHEAAGRAAVHSLLAEHACRRIAGAASTLAAPVTVLKGAALVLGGFTAPGSRSMCDVDVLAPEESARNLQHVLEAEGMEPFDLPESDHQLQFLRDRTGFGIEVHHRVPGLRVDGLRSATAADLLEAGLCSTSPGLPDGCLLPNWQVLLAHCLVHGIVQHGMSPAAYPMWRMVADVQDLGIDDEALRKFMEGGFAWIEREVSTDEVGAVIELVRHLGAGGDPSSLAGAADAAGTLLRHMVAGTTVPRYAWSLKFRSLTSTPKDTSRWRSLAGTARRALLPTRTQIDLLYGSPKSELGYWGRRLWRPFDLVGRSFRYGWAWLRVHGPCSGRRPRS